MAWRALLLNFSAFLWVFFWAVPWMGPFALPGALPGAFPGALSSRVEAANGTRWLAGPEGVVMRAAPDGDAAVLERLGEGRRLVEFERRGPWLRVLAMDAVGLEGWVLAENLEETTLIAPAALPPAESEEVVALRNVRPAQPFRLSIGGSPALAFGVDCSFVGTSGRQKTVKFDGLVPKSHRFSGRALSCLVSKQDARGRLEVRLTSGRNLVAQAETAAAYNYVRVRSAGPWGQAAGTRGAIPLARVQRSGPGRTVPFLRPPTVPPLRKP